MGAPWAMPSRGGGQARQSSEGSGGEEFGS